MLEIEGSNSMELYEYTVHELANLLEEGKVTSEEIVKSYFNRIEEKEDNVKAYVSLMKEDAICQAKRIDERRKAGVIVL